MGAPKQKWTAEEEAALKAGVRKHGMGKWRTILTDPEFNSVLRLRSNVDLKDKWRNINVTAIWGSRQKAKLALKREENCKALIVAQRNDNELSDAKPLSAAAGTSSNGGSKESPPKVDSMVMEAIDALKEPSGSDRASIALYLESKYPEMQNLRKVLAGKLNVLVSSGKVIKVKHKYKLAGNEGKGKEGAKVDKTLTKALTKAQVDQELSKLRGLSAMEIAAAAAKAVAEAEAAIAEAEQAAREAELAEAEAEAAQVFAKAAVKAFKYRLRYTW